MGRIEIIREEITMEGWEKAFRNIRELYDRKGEGLAIFSLMLKYGYEDIDELISEGITDGSDDKKIDILYVDRDGGKIFLMQCAYHRDSSRDPELNKATDLHAAVQYLLIVEEKDLSETIKNNVLDARQAIKEGIIHSLHIWYVHNRNEAASVDNELKQVRDNADHTIKSTYKNKITVESRQVGRRFLEETYKDAVSFIRVNDKIKFEIDGYYIVEDRNKKWRSVVTSVKGDDIYNLFKKYKEDLFSLNVRDYLGIVKKDENVNNNIRKSAINEPEKFWAFNNGITAMVHDFVVKDDILHVSGISIVNGAQTTGVIGNLDNSPDKALLIPIRFLSTKNMRLIEEITRFNNNQNAVEAADFRSTDEIQSRLRKEFDSIDGIEYKGGRRGGILNIIKRPQNRLDNYKVGQVITAFHGDPVLAYNEKSKIWQDNDKYIRVFNGNTTAKHIIFVYSLYKAIENKRSYYKKKLSENITKNDNAIKTLLSLKGSNFLLIYIVSELMEMIIGKSISNKFKLHFKGSVNMAKCVKKWDDVLCAILQLSETIYEKSDKSGLKSNEKADNIASEVRQLLSLSIEISGKGEDENIFRLFSKEVSV